MTALAGVWDFFGGEHGAAATAISLAEQKEYGPHGQATGQIGSVTFGRSLYRTLPEDSLDRQPLIDAAGRLMMVADVRLDNRDELLDRLERPSGAGLSDSEILFRLWERCREATLDHVIGDFAIAVWDAHTETLILARDPTGQRPLHYHVGDRFVAFASMARGLLAHPDIAPHLNEEQLAAFVADIPRDPGQTYFKKIARINPGEVATIRRSGVITHRYWQLPAREIYYPAEADYVEAFREQLDRAIRARSRGAERRIGVHLSAGLDSGAVASTAARTMASLGGEVVAFTSAPRLGFDGMVPYPRIGDESGAASQVAALYPNMKHIIVRPEGVSPLDLIGADAELFQEPVGHPCNIVWWWAALDEARARGLSVMLIGEAGNLTISAGGLASISDFVRKGQWRRWWREARAVAGTGPSWRGVLAASFGPWTPRSLWRLLSRLTGRDAGEAGTPLLHPALREPMAVRAAAEARSSYPTRNNRKARWESLSQLDPGSFRKGILARWGIDERDPTADRRLADFCFAIPPEILFSGGVMRRLARVGLADRLPATVLYGPRGYQYADWYEQIDLDRIALALKDLENGPAYRLLDRQSMADRGLSWPSSDWNSMENIGKYRLLFLRALSAGAFANRLGR